MHIHTAAAPRQAYSASGAATGLYTTNPSAKWYDKAAAAAWGFGMNSTIGIIGDASFNGGLVTSAVHGIGTGLVFARQA